MSKTTQQSSGPVRLGIIGSGLAVKWLHWPALQQLEGKFEIVVACDTNPAAAQEIATKAAKELNSPNCSWTTDYQEVLANDNVEAVLLSLPIHLTAQVILDSARAGKHVLSEKPLGSNLPQAQELVAALKGYDHLVIEIAENYHYREDFRKAKEWIKSGRIGDLLLVEIRDFFWTDVSQGFSATPWRHDNQYRGGIIADAGVHMAAALREFGGDVEQLQAFVKSVHPVMGGLDTMSLNVRYRNGAIGNLTYSGAVKPGAKGVQSISIFGTEGTIYVGIGDGAEKMSLHEGANQTGKLVEELEFPDGDAGYRGEFANFYAAIREGEPVVATVEETLKDWELIMRAIDSSEERSVILL